MTIKKIENGGRAFIPDDFSRKMLLDVLNDAEENKFWMPSVESENGFLYMIAFSLAKGNREPSKFVYDIWWKLVNLGILYKDKGLYSEANFIKRTRELVFQTADGSLDADLKIQI